MSPVISLLIALWVGTSLSCLPRLRFFYGIYHKVIQRSVFDGELKT
jgi:hypothetical protein